MEEDLKKVLFVCGSMEPGHDGVGDYVRVLSGALNSLGFDSRIIALKDRTVEGVVGETQSSGEQRISVVRLGKTLTCKTRKSEYQKILREFSPQWISLQYVPYAFSDKGTPLYLAPFLKSNMGVNWHFMIHEAYIGANNNLKRGIIKKLQISALRALVGTLKPSVIHTTISSYQSQLKTIGIESGILGLFGNIPIQMKGVGKDRTEEVFRGVYFGAPPQEEKFQIFIDAINDYLLKTSGRMELVLCGKSGNKGKIFATALRDGINSDQFGLVEKGSMAADELSALFLKMDFAIARIPPHLIGKSGSAIALLEHGLRLWLPLAESQEEIEENFDYRVNQCFVDLIELKNSEHYYSPSSRLDEVTRTFLEKLNFNEVTA